MVWEVAGSLSRQSVQIAPEIVLQVGTPPDITRAWPADPAVLLAKVFVPEA